MEPLDFDIGSRRELDDIGPFVTDTFIAQRRRLLATARGFADREWTHATRCGEWDVRQLLVHVLGATDACRATLTRERSVFGDGFDPNTGPNRFVDEHADQAGPTTLDELDDSITATADAMDPLLGQTPTPQMTAVWGQEVDWRLFVAHMFWDGWIHERDLLVPLRREHRPADAETRLAAAYGLHTAAIMAGLLAIPLDVTLCLSGPGGGTYRVTADGLDVTVSVTPMDLADGPEQGNAVAAIDALAGRGAELGTVLDAAPEVLDALSQVGAFLRGQAAAPQIPDR